MRDAERLAALFLHICRSLGVLQYSSKTFLIASVDVTINGSGDVLLSPQRMLSDATTEPLPAIKVAKLEEIGHRRVEVITTAGKLFVFAPLGPQHGALFWKVEEARSRAAKGWERPARTESERVRA